MFGSKNIILGNGVNMKLWILTVYMMTGQTIYGYKFVEKVNCEKVGKDLVKLVKSGHYKCKLKSI